MAEVSHKIYKLSTLNESPAGIFQAATEGEKAVFKLTLDQIGVEHYVSRG